MSELMEALLRRHQETLEDLKYDEIDEVILGEIGKFISDLRQAGSQTGDIGERSQLRALLHYWANLVFDNSNVYPDVTLFPPPAGTGELTAPEPSGSETTPVSAFKRLGVSAVLVLAGVIVSLIWQFATGADIRDLLAPVSVPSASAVAVGMGTEGAGGVSKPADTFCADTPEIIADFALQGTQPGMNLRWELQRAGEVIAAQKAAPWGDEESKHVTVRILTDENDSIKPGRYDLLVYLDDQIIGSETFELLASAPAISGLHVSDVPDVRSLAAPAGDYKAGLRVLYLYYTYENLCTGLDVSSRLYHNAELVQEIQEQWAGAASGDRQQTFQASGDDPFAAGEYEIAIAIGRVERERVSFTVAGGARTAASAVPTVSDITLALGVLPDGTPVLPPSDARFDWNTKVVYGVFDYVNMQDGAPWSAAWNRSGEEISREEGFWDTEADGTKGSTWVTYFDPGGQVLPSGRYSLTLYAENMLMGAADFDVLAYVPRE
jgi:hypothetical protein